MTWQFSSFTILSQYHFAQIHSLWLSVFDSFEVFCLGAPLQPSIHLCLPPLSLQCSLVSPSWPAKPFGTSCQVLAQMTFAVSPLPGRSELVMGFPTPSSFKNNLQCESKLGCGLVFFLMNDI